MKKYLCYYRSPIGKLGIIEDGKGICELFPAALPSCTEDLSEEETPLLKEAVKQLKEYFQGSRTRFELPLSLTGTPFQKAVWEALLEIPYGQTRSYQEIARAVGNEKACRAVGMANHHNPVMIVVPCHRVIGKGGKLTGYASGLETKEKLLALEKRKSKSI